MANPRRVVLVHDWLTGMRGGEKVLEVFADLFPDAPIYTLIHQPGSLSPKLEARRIVTSRLQRLPLGVSKYRYYLPVLPRLIEQLAIEPCDLVLSTSSCVAKGAIAPPGALHASYILSPMRYIYDRYDDYFGPGKAGLITRSAMRMVRPKLQRWDIESAKRLDHISAISTFIADRIKRYYDRSVPVIHPPVDTSRFQSAKRTQGDYYLVVSALVPYKNVDLAMDAFAGLDRKLVIAGGGPMLDQLRSRATSNVNVMGWVDDAQLTGLVAGCRAFIFPQVEDFGIAPVEAMAAGKPVIALGQEVRWTSSLTLIALSFSKLQE